MNRSDYFKNKKQVEWATKRREQLANVAKYLHNTYEYRNQRIGVKINQDQLDIRVTDGIKGLNGGFIGLSWFADFACSEAGRGMSFLAKGTEKGVEVTIY